MSFSLRNKTILLISPNEWGRMRVSKHHYAVELSRRGNTVFFLNPPRPDRTGRIQVERDAEIEGLFLVDYSPQFPTALRFRVRWLFDFLMGRQIRAILREIGRPIDLVWSFEPNLFSDLGRFGASTKIFHPVDQVVYDYQVKVGRSADLVISVAEPILGRFDGLDVPKLLLGHGLAECFAPLAEERLQIQEYCPPARLRAGYIGNLWIDQMDRGAFRRVVETSPDVEFHVWGPLAPEESNLSGGASPEALDFLAFLSARPNVRLHGVASPEQIARSMAMMDVFLLCYDVKRDPNGGSNSHKILEYLSTGRVVVASPVSSYRDRSWLLRMASNGDMGTPLAAIFRETVDEIAFHNRPELQRARSGFALEHTYAKQIDRIESMLTRSPTA